MKAEQSAQPETGVSCVPLRAARDDALSPEALRLLIALAAHADEAGWCTADPQELGAVTGLAPAAVSRGLGELETALYLARRGEPAPGYRIVSDLEQAELAREAGRILSGRGAEGEARPQAATARGKRRGVRRLLRVWHAVDRFQFWARIVLSPEEAEAFWLWALEHEADYHGFVHRFAEALDDGDLEALLRDMVATVAQRGGQKDPDRVVEAPAARSATRA